MEQILFERPREKLRHRGAGYLSLTELIQLVIGSGGARVSGARLARRVQRLIQSDTLTYEALVAISGLGAAKASQILAALELGLRVKGLRQDNQQLTAEAVQALTISVQQERAPAVVSFWFDGSLRFIDKKRYTLPKGEHASATVRRLYADAVAVSARSVLVCLALPRASLTMTPVDQSLVRSMYDTANLLQIKLIGVHAVNRSTSRHWSEGL